jgi:hypothetical protein
LSAFAAQLQDAGEVTGPAADPLLAAKGAATAAAVEPEPSTSPAAKVTILACRRVQDIHSVGSMFLPAPFEDNIWHLCLVFVVFDT